MPFHFLTDSSINIKSVSVPKTNFCILIDTSLPHDRILIPPSLEQTIILLEVKDFSSQSFSSATLQVVRDWSKINKFGRVIKNRLHLVVVIVFVKDDNASIFIRLCYNYNLDVLVERHDSEFLTSVYRKPTFTGQYLRWNSFSPQKRKINLIGTLVHRAFMICSKSKLDQELGKIRSILLENGYPERVINSAFKRKLQQINSNPVHTVKKCLVYLYIPWIGNVSMRFEKQITSAVKRCFFSVEPRVIFNTRQLLPAIKKDVLPSHHHSNVIYQFLCHCDSRYVGRMSQRLEERIKQHVPKSITNPRTSANRQILSRSCKNNIRPQQFHESAIGQHLLDNAQCALHYSNEKFSILARGRSSFHLSALEATFIKSLNPLLCKQKEFVYSLKIS